MQSFLSPRIALLALVALLSIVVSLVLLQFVSALGDQV